MHLPRYGRGSTTAISTSHPSTPPVNKILRSRIAATNFVRTRSLAIAALVRASPLKWVGCCFATKTYQTRGGEPGIVRTRYHGLRDD